MTEKTEQQIRNDREREKMNEIADRIEADHGIEHPRHAMWKALAAWLRQEGEVVSYGDGDTTREAALTFCFEYEAARP